MSEYAKAKSLYVGSELAERDVELTRLQTALAERDAEVARLRALIGTIHANYRDRLPLRISETMYDALAQPKEPQT